MPEINLPIDTLKMWGKKWLSDKNDETNSSKQKNAFDKKQSVNFGILFDNAVGTSLANFLGDIPIENPTGRSRDKVLLPKIPNCVEVGPVRIIGGIRPQNFDVGYRPDGPRFVYDSKTLNDLKSIAKNWQNMINDLGTEAATIHTRYPYCIVSFIVAIPKPALMENQKNDITQTLERLGTRKTVLDQSHLAEAISLVIWDPKTGVIDKNFPKKDTGLRIEDFSEKIAKAYSFRYKGLPPHGKE